MTKNYDKERCVWQLKRTTKYKTYSRVSDAYNTYKKNRRLKIKLVQFHFALSSQIQFERKTSVMCDILAYRSLQSRRLGNSSPTQRFFHITLFCCTECRAKSSFVLMDLFKNDDHKI